MDTLKTEMLSTIHSNINVPSCFYDSLKFIKQIVTKNICLFNYYITYWFINQPGNHYTILNG